MSSNSPDFGTSRFSTTKDRNAAAKDILTSLFSAATERIQDPTLSESGGELLKLLLGSLLNDQPSASQAAEGALTILALTLAEQRRLDISTRIPGDRALGDWLCEHVLRPRNIPSTQGPFQSSSFRAGYASDQVRNDGLRHFTAWYSDVANGFEELQAFAIRLTEGFASRAVSLPAMPKIAAARLTHANFRMFREMLLEDGSGGALEQYLLAGLLSQELATTGAGHRIHTKNVGASDAATNSGGDVEVRHGQTLLKAYEVTANEWSTKLAQLNSSAAAGLDEVTIVANGVAGVPADVISQGLSSRSEQLGVDVAVLDLPGLLDVLASRISRHARAEAILFLYQSLARWHQRQPELITRVVGVLRQLNLVVEGTFMDVDTAGAADPNVSIELVRDVLVQLQAIDQPELPEVLRTLASELEAESKRDCLAT